jgi:predicted DNA-binding transcriptional regulator YafY
LTTTLLSDLGEGVLTPHVKPLLTRLNSLLGSQKQTAEEVRNRIRILHMASRATKLPHFETVASATLKRQRLQIRYRARSTDVESERDVSPQRLVHYRDNWYLDGWCHLRKGLRSFSVDAIQSARILDKQAKAVSEKTLNEVLASGYGIFSGKNLTWAKLRFSPEQARWVSSEQWHPEQKGTFDDAGFYLLEFPYSSDRELIMDILKYGPEVEVLSPGSLRAKVQEQLQAAVRQYDT